MTYLDDILEQPAALHRLADRGLEPSAPLPLAADYDRILLTGMGGSHFANYWLWRELRRHGHDASWVPADELLSLDEPDGPRTLAIAVSQSGRSGETVAWADRHRGDANIDILAVTNNPRPEGLAPLATFSVDILAGPEETVGTKTYLNTLAAHRLLADALTGVDPAATVQGIHDTADGIRAFLEADWRTNVETVVPLDRAATAKLIVGRGAAYGTALQAALIIKEAAKAHYEGMSAGQLRHGPLDLADDKLLVWLLVSDAEMASENARLAAELTGHGAQVLQTGGRDLPGVHTIPAPTVPDAFADLGMIVPIQLANIPLAEAAGFVPGAFRHNEKVTTAL